ncbi:MAG: beta-carotene isomerase domain-containing protein [Spirochaetaceae bacterium]
MEVVQPGEKPIPGIVRRTILKRVVRALYAEAGGDAPPLIGSYDDLIRAADQFEAAMGGREALRAGGLRVIERVLPEPVAVAARLLIHNPEVTGKIAVLAVPPAVSWLVGGVERKMYRNRAVIRKCRFLEASGSVEQCLHLCKGPSERFFTERLNIAMKMTPNLESGECTLTFGRQAQRAERGRGNR